MPPSVTISLRRYELWGEDERRRSYLKKPSPWLSNLSKVFIFLFHWFSTNVSYSAESLEGKKTEWQDTIRNKGDSLPPNLDIATLPCTHHCTNMNVVQTQINIRELHIDGNNTVNFGDSNHIDSGDQLKTEIVDREREKEKMDSLVKSLVDAVRFESVLGKSEGVETKVTDSSFYLRLLQIIVYVILVLSIFLRSLGIINKWEVRAFFMKIKSIINKIDKWLL